MQLRNTILQSFTLQQPQTKLRVAEDASREVSQFTWLGLEDDSLQLWDEGGSKLNFPPHYLTAVMERYGKELSDSGDFIAHMRLPGELDSYLVHMLYVPEFDVVPKDYLVWVPQSGPPLFELNAHILPPLRHLAARHQKRISGTRH